MVVIADGLQAALLREGCYPGEEEMEDWVFGEGTNSALLTFQAVIRCSVDSPKHAGKSWSAPPLSLPFCLGFGECVSSNFQT